MAVTPRFRRNRRPKKPYQVYLKRVTYLGLR